MPVIGGWASDNANLLASQFAAKNYFAGEQSGFRLILRQGELEFASTVSESRRLTRFVFCRRSREPSAGLAQSRLLLGDHCAQGADVYGSQGYRRQDEHLQHPRPPSTSLPSGCGSHLLGIRESILVEKPSKISLAHFLLLYTARQRHPPLPRHHPCPSLFASFCRCRCRRLDVARQ